MTKRIRIGTSHSLAAFAMAAIAACVSVEKAAAPAPAPSVPTATVTTTIAMSADDEDEPVHDGKWLYGRNCAGCHNDNGDGKGATMEQLKLQARDFKQGGFAFGNTREALYRTITAGMPGSEVMPSFKGAMNDDERWLVADYVLTLCPAPDQQALDSRLDVRDRPQIARGLLPALAPGKPRWPRGTLLGTPEGLSFEYRSDDVRLLAVRQGEFADRTDWNDRGGSELVPLGKVVYLPGGGNPLATFHAIAQNSDRELVAKLRSTIATRDALGFDYELFAPKDERLAFVSERLRVEALSIGGVFTRSFEFHGAFDSTNLLLDFGAAEGGGEWIRGEPSGWKPTGRRERGILPSDGWLVGKRGERFELVHVVADPSVRLVHDANSLVLYVPVIRASENMTVRCSVSFVVVNWWSEELLAKLGQELSR
jgi:mono/diheme cytochrome c family protein